MGGPRPVHLFVSGRGAPQTPPVPHKLAAMSLPELADFLRHLGGTPEVVLRDHRRLAALRPVLAADFAVSERYKYLPEPPLDVPTTAFAGLAGGETDPAAMARWESQTTGPFRLHVLSGGPSAIFDDAPAARAAITAALTCPAADGWSPNWRRPPGRRRSPRTHRPTAYPAPAGRTG
jgi:surfactin synthase thioesterase subunit